MVEDDVASDSEWDLVELFENLKCELKEMKTLLCKISCNLGIVK